MDGSCDINYFHLENKLDICVKYKNLVSMLYVYGCKHMSKECELFQDKFKKCLK